jgi:hypothetical protein
VALGFTRSYTRHTLNAIPAGPIDFVAKTRDRIRITRHRLRKEFEGYPLSQGGITRSRYTSPIPPRPNSATIR